MKTAKKILLVDDEPDILEFLSYNFRKKGYEVIVAADGKEGVVKAKTIQPDLVISDILMPEMDGIEMCTLIRLDPDIRLVPFIFLTAVSDDYKILYAMTSGADQFVSKPVKFEYLHQIVGQMLEIRPMEYNRFTI